MAKPFKRKIKDKNGNVTSIKWYIRYKINGKYKWEPIGDVGVVTKTVAQNVLQERKRQIALEQHDQIHTKIPTISEFKSKFISYKKDVLANRTWDRDLHKINRFIEYAGDEKLSLITPGEIINYQRKRIKQGAKPATVNRELACIKNLFNIAKQMNCFFGDNPVSKVKFLEENNKIERILTINEEQKLLNNSAPHIKPIIFTALYTGMRKWEILSLKWMNVDLENNIITVDASINKSKVEKQIPVCSSLRSMLLEQRLKTGFQEYVFLTPKGEPYKRSDSLKGSFLNACKNAGIGHLRFHDLRHTWATRAIEVSGNVVAVSKILGHKSLETTMRYVHPDKVLHETAEKVGNLASNCSNSCSNENQQNIKEFKNHHKTL